MRWVTGRPPSQDLTLPQLAMAGAGAGAVTSFVLTPVELVKCKMQVQMLAVDGAGTSVQSPPSGAGAATATLGPTLIKPRTLPGPIAVLTSVIRNDGVRGLWLGQTGTLIRETGGGAAWFACKEFVGTRLVQRRATRMGTTLTRDRKSVV